jgi:hypothetical protein
VRGAEAAGDVVGEHDAVGLLGEDQVGAAAVALPAVGPALWCGAADLVSSGHSGRTGRSR